VSVVIKLDHRPGVVDAMSHKVQAIEERLGDAYGVLNLRPVARARTPGGQCSRDRARLDELEKVVRAARLRTRPESPTPPNG